MGKIEGKILDEEEKPAKGYPFSIFYEDEKIPLKETKTDGEGNFKVEVRESFLEKVIFTKEGYSPLILNNLEIKNAPEILILKGLGKFKVKLLFEGGIKPEIVSNLTKEIVFLKEEKFEEKGMISLNMTQNEINLEAELEEGTYKLKIKGEFFKQFISSPFTIYSKKEYDYFDKLNYFELNLNPSNYLKIKISKLKPEKDSYQLLLRFKSGIIKDKISYGEEKTYKNLFSPVEIEIISEGEVIWKEVIELREGENILYL